MRLKLCFTRVILFPVKWFVSLKSLKHSKLSWISSSWFRNEPNREESDQLYQVLYNRYDIQSIDSQINCVIKDTIDMIYTP